MIKGGIEKKRQGYKKYRDAVERINLVGWIKEEIEKKPERIIVVKIDDIIKEMGSGFQKAGYQKIYHALKVILFQNGIFLRMATHRDGDETFVLREVEKEDRLAPSYLSIKKRIKKEKMPEIEKQGLDGSKDEEKGKEEQEKIAMRKEIRRLKELFHGVLGNKPCLIEIFQFNWDTLTWGMVKRSSVRSYIKLLEVVVNYTSTTENRYRIEFTPIHELENMEKELPKDDNKGEEKGGIKGKGDLAEELICPRCGGNIKTWSTVQVIKTRSGDRKLRHRCENCNETFSDEDLGIRQ